MKNKIFLIIIGLTGAVPSAASASASNAPTDSSLGGPVPASTLMNAAAKSTGVAPKTPISGADAGIIGPNDSPYYAQFQSQMGIMRLATQLHQQQVTLSAVTTNLSAAQQQQLAQLYQSMYGTNLWTDPQVLKGSS